MKFTVNERFFDSTLCQTYYEGRTYDVSGPDLDRIKGHIERHAMIVDAGSQVADSLESLSREELGTKAEALGLKVNANVNKQMIIAMIRGAR